MGRPRKTAEDAEDAEEENERLRQRLNSNEAPVRPNNTLISPSVPLKGVLKRILRVLRG